MLLQTQHDKYNNRALNVSFVLQLSGSVLLIVCRWTDVVGERMDRGGRSSVSQHDYCSTL